MEADWVRGRELGRGSFATVNLAVSRGQDHRFPALMAVKSCGVSHSSSLMNEKLILDELKDCPEVVGCLGESFSCERGERLYNVLLEYAAGGDLADRIKNAEGRRLPESEVRRYVKALLRGLRYIHKRGYVHCDIKLQNILLGPNGEVKIADFGLAKRAGRRSPSFPGSEFRGTPLYMSPETVTVGEQEAPSDIWALGCAVKEMLSGTPAWECSDVAALLMKIGVGDESPEMPNIISENGKDFLRNCFVKDPSKRWTAEMLLNHPFVSDNSEFNTATATATSTSVEDEEKENRMMSPSPRCPFDFPDWESVQRCSITSLPSPEVSSQPGFNTCGEPSSRNSPPSLTAAERLPGIFSSRSPNWTISDDWITVR